jgi:hypothetical protein
LRVNYYVHYAHTAAPKAGVVYVTAKVGGKTSKVVVGPPDRFTYT